MVVVKWGVPKDVQRHRQRDIRLKNEGLIITHDLCVNNK